MNDFTRNIENNSDKPTNYWAPNTYQILSKYFLSVPFLLAKYYLFGIRDKGTEPGWCLLT